MAEVVLISLASKILVTIAAPAFKKAYGMSSSIWGAGKDVDALKGTLRTIQANLDVAGRNQDSDPRVRDWTERIGDVLHEADDLFDEVAANQLLKQQMQENRLLKEVRVSFSKFNPILSNNSIAKKVKEIRNKLENISRDFALPCPVPRQPEEPESYTSTEIGSDLVNPQGIVGRDDDLRNLKHLLLGSNTSSVSIVAIVGIAGMGKTTLAQLIFNDDQVQNEFQKRWWVCISDTSGQRDQVLLRIFQSIKGESYGGHISHLESEISKLVIKTMKDSRGYLLILDDVQDKNHGIWYPILSLLCRGAKGSKIIVTTRYSPVAAAMNAETYNLEGLSDLNSWELFRRIAFTEGQDNHARRNRLGREIVNKCANVPLSINCIATLLRSKAGIQEWQSICNDPNLQYEGDDSIMYRLKLIFDNLPSDVKPCFAYCSLFPKHREIVKEELIYLWIAQGYVKPKCNETSEEVGNAYFNQLLRSLVFQELQKDEHGEIITCKMHAAFHQLAQNVAGGGSVILTKQWDQFHYRIRHLTVGYEMDNSWTIPELLFAANRLRSSLFMYKGSLGAPALDKLLTEFKFLRALNLEDLKVGKVSTSVGELKHLRYLNLSENTFTNLPSSITKLVNLLTLDISCCVQLRALPNDFRKLTNLRVLNAEGCCSLMRMPTRFGELTSLEYLSYFNVGEEEGGGCKNRRMLDVLKLRRKELHQLPTTVRVLKIENPTMTMPYWDIPSLLPNLVKLHLFNSETIDWIPPLRCLSSLMDLRLSNLEQLQYVEKDEDRHSSTTEAGSSTTTFFPCLEGLTLENLPILEGWSREEERIIARQSIGGENEEQMRQFPKLLTLRILNCPNLKFMPQLPADYETLELRCVTVELAQQLEQA